MAKCECCVVVPGSSMHGTHVRVAEPATSQGSGITAEVSDWLDVNYYCILIARCVGCANIFIQKLRSNFPCFQFSDIFH